MNSPCIDFPVYWRAAWQLNQGNSPYAPDSAFYYPLFAAAIFVPFQSYSLKSATRAWNILNLLFVFAGAGLAAAFFQSAKGAETSKGAEGASRAMGMNAPSSAATPPSACIRAAMLRYWPFAVFFLVFNFLPLHQSLEQGNIDPLIFLLFLAFFCCVLKRWDWAAGALLGAAALIKIIAAILIVPLLAARRYKAAAMFFVVAIIYGAILSATGAWRIEMELYLEQLPAASFHGIGYSSSLHKWIPALMFPKLLENPESFSRWSFLLSSFFIAGFLSVCLAASIRRSFALEHLLGFSFFAMPLCSPLLEYNHYVWLLPILLLQIHSWASGKMGNAAFALMTAGWLGILLIRILNNYYRVLSFRFNILSLGPAILLGMAILEAALALRADNMKGREC